MPVRLQVESPAEFIRAHLSQAGQDYPSRVFRAYRRRMRSTGLTPPSRASFSRVFYILRRARAIEVVREERIDPASVGPQDSLMGKNRAIGWAGKPQTSPARGVGLPSPRRFYSIINPNHPAWTDLERWYRSQGGIPDTSQPAPRMDETWEPLSATFARDRARTALLEYKSADDGRQERRRLRAHLQAVTQMGLDDGLRGHLLDLVAQLAAWGAPAEPVRDALIRGDVDAAIAAMDALPPQVRPAVAPPPRPKTKSTRKPVEKPRLEKKQKAEKVPAPAPAPAPAATAAPKPRKPKAAPVEAKDLSTAEALADPIYKAIAKALAKGPLQIGPGLKFIYAHKFYPYLTILDMKAVGISTAPVHSRPAGSLWSFPPTFGPSKEHQQFKARWEMEQAAAAPATAAASAQPAPAPAPAKPKKRAPASAEELERGADAFLAEILDLMGVPDSAFADHRRKAEVKARMTGLIDRMGAHYDRVDGAAGRATKADRKRLAALLEALTLTEEHFNAAQEALTMSEPEKFRAELKAMSECCSPEGRARALKEAA